MMFMLLVVAASLLVFHPILQNKYGMLSLVLVDSVLNAASSELVHHVSWTLFRSDFIFNPLSLRVQLHCAEERIGRALSNISRIALR